MPTRLKSLELHGYKTFANRTLFEFAGTVTAIVGPNGSGKSNIADSLRWVLGEQSYSLLRAKKTEDMIFSGSENRPRAGMASASITFDNSDNWLPIDFSEVAITRRAYRDGQNEYLINGQRMRLKDVSELLAQSGLAERTYTVIGQGLVDAALSLKAEERRRLFEEAAGIGLHRSRREDALKRLDNTRRNLERVQDILSELQPRLRSLERQARRVQEYEQVKTDLQEMLREWYGYHWHRSQFELTQSKHAARIEETNLNKARKAQQTLDTQLGALRSRIQELRQNLNLWRRELTELHTRREVISRDLAVSSERQLAIRQQQAAAETQIINTEQELILLQEQLQTSQDEVERIQKELLEAHEQSADAQKELVQRQQERDQVEVELRRIRQEIARLNGRQGQIQAQIQEKQSQRVRYLDSLHQAEQASIKIEKEQKEAQSALEKAKAAEEKARQAHSKSQTALERHREHLQEIETQNRQLLQERAALSAAYAKTKAEWEVLAQAESSLTGYASGTRILLEAAHKKIFSGAKGALSTHLQVPAEIEIAITAALGEYLDAVVLDENLDQALDMLIEKAGRGVLLPVQALSTPAAPAEIASSSQLIGLASRLVQVSEKIQPVVDLLLGQTWVVRDRETARKILQGSPLNLRAVTLNGEVFDARGPVYVYAPNQQAGNRSLLERNRKQRELSSLLDEQQSKTATLEGKIVRLENDWNRQKEEEQTLVRLLKDESTRLEQSVSSKHQADLRLEQLKRQSGWQQEQIARLRKEMDRDESETTRLNNELTALEITISETREKMRQQSGLLESKTLDELQANQAHWRTLVSVSQKALNDSQQRMQERQQACSRQENYLRSLQAQKSNLEQGMTELSSEQISLKKEEGELSEKLHELHEYIDPTEVNLVDLEKQLIGQEKDEAASRQELSQAEHQNAQARINLARRQEMLQSLRRRIEDDFGLVAFEYEEQVSGPTPLPLEGMVEQLPRVEKLSPDVDEAIKRQRAQLRRIGAINPEAQNEFQEVKQRFEFLTEQVDDLTRAEEDVRHVIAELDQIMEQELLKTFEAVAAEFKQIFIRLFGGGSARLLLTDPEDLTNSGIDIEARLPGRRSQGLSLLSGGERSLTATALIFSLLKVSPTPFCVLDEVDAMLDEANVGRFRELLRELSVNTQFVIVTHNRNTVQVADVIYGVTMGRDSSSQVLSLKLDEVSQVVSD